MRKLKFRVWDPNYKRMYSSEDTGITITLCGKIRREERYEGSYEIKGIIQQFTGACDSNGKEIYEGDILRTENGYGCWITFRSIEWNNYWFAYGLKNGSLLTTQINEDRGYKKYIVVGNIYQNQELLKLLRGIYRDENELMEKINERN